MTIVLGSPTSKIDVIDEHDNKFTIEVNTDQLLLAMFEDAICHNCGMSEDECECEDKTWIW